MKYHLILAVLCAATPVLAQIPYSTNGATYSQTFDSLPSSGGFQPFNNNSTIPGWYALDRNGNELLNGSANIRPDDGNNTLGTLYSYGRSSDRAFGLIPAGSSQVYNFVAVGQIAAYIGFGLTNTTATTLTSFTLTFTGEQWRAERGSTFPLQFAYSENAASLVDGSATFSTVPELQFTLPQSVGQFGTPIALDGNAAPNRTTLTHTVSGLDLTPGETLWLRWAVPTPSGDANHGVAIDDVQVRAVPEPATTLYLAIGLSSILFFHRRR